MDRLPICSKTLQPELDEPVLFITFRAMDKILDDLHGQVFERLGRSFCAPLFESRLSSSSQLFSFSAVPRTLSTTSGISDPGANDICTGDTENNELGIVRGRLSGIPIIAFEKVSSAEAMVIFIVFLRNRKRVCRVNSEWESFSNEYYDSVRILTFRNSWARKNYIQLRMEKKQDTLRELAIRETDEF